MTRQADNADIVSEILATKLSADTEILSCFLQLFFHLDVAERLTVVIALSRQSVKFFGCGQLDGLHNCISRGAANNEGEVIGGARRSTEGLHLGNQVVEKLLRREQSLGLLEEHRFVGRTAAFSYKEEFVGVAFGGVEVNLSRQVGACVLLIIHVERHGLAVAQVFFGVGLVDALGNVFSIVNTSPNLLPFLGNDCGSTGVLAGW